MLFRNTHVGLENSSISRTFTVPSYHVLSKVHSYHVLSNTTEKKNSLSVEDPSGYNRTMCLVARRRLNLIN